MHEEYFIDGVRVEVFGVANFDREEARRYVEYAREQLTTWQHMLGSLEIVACPDSCVDVYYTLKGPKFERIRRITGYLTGSIDSWNNAKRAEERDRVKHGLDGVAV